MAARSTQTQHLPQAQARELEGLPDRVEFQLQPRSAKTDPPKKLAETLRL